jgi:oligoribonuclease NrnB/cAMP/cGMP phosphodiesterase (DHH superfamily)
MAGTRIRTKKKIVVIYHASCPDGFGAAYAAWRKFKGGAEYHGVSHSQEPLDLAGREVYFLDLVYGPEEMRRVAGTAEKIIVIDHHVSAKESVKFADEAVYDLNHSGAYLAWKYFHPRTPVPRLLLHIEDEDLWKFRLRHTMAVSARLELLDFDFRDWHQAVKNLQKPETRRRFIREGELLAAYRTRLVRRFVEENAVPVRFLGYEALAVNAAKPFASEVGHALCKLKPPIGIIWHEKRDVITVSLRSDGSVDVAELAARFGGGGHKAAAGFSLPLHAKKPWMYEKKYARKSAAGKKKSRGQGKKVKVMAKARTKIKNK